MYLVERHIINNKHTYFRECENICFLSKNLYNSALYTIRQEYFTNKKYINFYDINKIFIKNKQQDYINLPRKVSNETLKLVDKNFKSFFSLLKLKLNGKYDKKINIPKYLDKKGKFITVYDRQALSLKIDNKIKLSKTNIIIDSLKKEIKQVRIIPKLNYYIIEVVYKKIEKNIKRKQ